MTTPFTFMRVWKKGNTPVRARLTLCSGRATKISTRVITASPAFLATPPTPFLPWRGRLGRHGIYLFNSAIGIDTGYNLQSPLTCLSLPDFTLYQTFADGETATHHITSFIPETLREMQRNSAVKAELND